MRQAYGWFVYYAVPVKQAAVFVAKRIAAAPFGAVCYLAGLGVTK